MAEDGKAGAVTRCIERPSPELSGTQYRKGALHWESSGPASCPARPRQGAAFENFFLRRHPVGQPNFNFQKRQKELAKKKKNEEKRQRKLDKNAVKPGEDQGRPAEGGEDNTKASDAGIS
jgi:hypothetical protein